MKVPLVVFVTIMHIINYLSACSCPTAGACSVQCSKFVYLSGAHNTTRDRNIALEQFRDCKTACFRNSRRTNNCADLEELEDACKCDVGYYLDKTANETCRPHSSCLPGEGVSSPGTFSHDTVCEQCDSGTFSPTNSSEDPCTPCSYCNETEVVIAQCSTVSDTQCNTTVGLASKDIGEIDTLEKDFDNRLDSEEKHITQVVISSNIGTSGGVGALLLFNIVVVIVYMKRKKKYCFKRANSEPLLRNQNNSNTDSSSPPLYEATSCSTSDNYQNSQLQEINVQQTCGMYNPKFEHVNEYSEGSVLDFKIHPNQSDVKSCPNESHCWTCISNSKNSSNTECAKFMNHAQISCDEPGVETVLPKNAYALYSNMQFSPGTQKKKTAVYTFHRVLTDLSYHLCGIEWEMFFRRLIGEGTDEILGRVKRDHARSVREQIYHMLLEWKKIVTNEATLDVIIKELEDFNENLLASLYRGKLPYIEY